MKASLGFWGILLLLALNSCERPVANSPEMENYDLSKLETEGLILAELRNIDNQVIEQGYFLNGEKHGTWVKYSPDAKRVEEMTGYIQGQVEGMTIKLNKTGQLSERAFYKQNKLDGLYQKYEYGKLKMEAHYNKGVLDGRVTKYINFSNKVLSEADYKNGQLHGIFRHYDDEGNVTLEYEYADGEKISGSAK